MAGAMLLVAAEEERLRRQVKIHRRTLREASQPMMASEKEFMGHYRLGKADYERLCEDLIPLLPVTQRTSAVRPEIKILAALAFYANGCYQKNVGAYYHLGLAQPTVSACLKEVTNALNHPSIQMKYIRFPRSRTERENVARRKLHFSTERCTAMKAACIVLTILICLAIMAVCVMVKFATDVSVEERTRELGGFGGEVYQLPKSMGVIALSANASIMAGERFPYVGAVIRNTSTASWSFACFASIILVNWIVTSAHCRRAGSTHRVLLYRDFVQNHTHMYPILFWRLHEKYNTSDPTPQYDIAVAKLNVDKFPFFIKSSVFDDTASLAYVDASVWKTVSSMDKKLYLTNDFEKFEGLIVNSMRCFETYGYELNESMICVDFSKYEDCFLHEFGPLYAGDKVVGILTVKPRDCDLKFAVFTNVSYYAQWILKSTHTTYYG